MEFVVSEAVDKLLKSENKEDNELGLYLMLPQFKSSQDIYNLLERNEYKNGDSGIWFNVIFNNFFDEHKNKL